MPVVLVHPNRLSDIEKEKYGVGENRFRENTQTFDTPIKFNDSRNKKTGCKCSRNENFFAKKTAKTRMLNKKQ